MTILCNYPRHPNGKQQADNIKATYVSCHKRVILCVV
jgi:hypothetical protein